MIELVRETMTAMFITVMDDAFHYHKFLGEPVIVVVK